MNIIKVCFLLTFLLVITSVFAQKPENWTKDQLMQPSVLAEALKLNRDVPFIISVGPGAVIPNSVAVGPGQEVSNIETLKKELSAVHKDSAVVIYCGCCPFDRCPNVRPAIALLKDMKFTNYKLLNLTQNVKADWLDKGYPAIKQ